jgi:hypothetical protein
MLILTEPKGKSEQLKETEGIAGASNRDGAARASQTGGR